MEQIDDKLAETPQEIKQESLWKDNKRVAKRNLMALGKALWWIIKAIVEIVGWILTVIWEYIEMGAKAVGQVVMGHKMISMGILSVLLLLCNLGQWAYNRATEENLQWRIDSLELKCDTLRNYSLYDIGYRDGLVHGNELAVK